jgi:hypothetical protein
MAEAASQEERVLARAEYKSLSASKSFTRGTALQTMDQCDFWIGELASNDSTLSRARAANVDGGGGAEELYDRVVDHRADYDQAPTTVTVAVSVAGDVSESARARVCRN